MFSNNNQDLPKAEREYFDNPKKQEEGNIYSPKYKEPQDIIIDIHNKRLRNSNSNKTLITKSSA